MVKMTIQICEYALKTFSYCKDKPKHPKRKINVDYELDKNKAIINKKDASEREFNVFLEYKKGNIVLTFSTAGRISRK
jgi:hypothetical protein